MSNPSRETVVYPFSAFNFAVEINVQGVSTKACNAAFSECDGLEMTMEVKTIREGGNNGEQLRLTGPASYGMLTLKRGMTANFDLWDWFAATVVTPSLRADAEVVVFASDGKTELVRFLLKRCLPAKMKAPALNAKEGIIAIEEMQLAYESLTLKRPGDSDGSGFGAGASLGAGASASAGVGVGVSASAGVSVGASASFGAQIG
jgi:phage tail-like protein